MYIMFRSEDIGR